MTTQRTLAPLLAVVVDDALDVRRLVGRMLEEFGFRVLEASSVEQGRQVIREAEGPVDLLVTDVLLPPGLGDELAREVREDHPDTRVLYMSGYTREELVRLGFGDVDAPMLSKPFDARELSEMVKRVMM